ncbi:putative dihydropyrimidine dehydrogenase [Halobacterium hubeiense]|uniref:Putative dihydropyrimidine dehydrogenase n=1 Tax=Halobacterium hubeiense TaxID=1407499 RepID=A0A0U5CZA5_9EURY|nr:tRNA-dihydrouridine synthase [Halobacterium hubeiense]CQH58968.1 putative dihydropyrimidine dehydrogenase [Halobacterium hubeiense]
MFAPRVALASLSGESDAEWAEACARPAGAAFLGGIAIDEPTRDAAREMVERDREEFLPDDPIVFVDDQLAELDDAFLRAGMNVRAVELDPLREVAVVCADHDAMLEVNAHCRQDEMCDAGAGETLLRDTERLCEQVETASDAGAAVSVKVRAEVEGVHLPTLAKAIERAGADAIHVDAMDSRRVVRDVAEATDCFVVANNGVRDREDVFEYLAYGADAVSVGRPSRDPEKVQSVYAAVKEWFL